MPEKTWVKAVVYDENDQRSIYRGYLEDAWFYNPDGCIDVDVQILESDDDY